MSAGFQSQTSNNGRYQETHRTRFPVTFSHLNLDELSKELDRRTKETQMLQEEVEHATKQALESAGGLNNTLAQSCLTTMFDMDDSVLQPLGYDQDDLSSEVTRRSLSFLEEDGISLLKEVLENPVEEGSKEELSQLHKQLEKTRARYEHLRFHFLQTVVRLETELQEVQVERAVLSDLRMKDLRQHADQMDRMRGGLQSISWSDSGDHQRLRETEHESRSLGRTSESVEQTFKRVYSDLVAREKQAGLCDSVASLGHAAACPGDDTASPGQFPPKAAEQLGSEQLKYQGKATMMLQENISRNQAESHACLNECQVIELESALSLYKDKVCSLERQLPQTQSQMDEAFMRQAERLQSQRVQITSELRQAHDDLSQEKERSEQLGVRCVGLCATVEELRKELDERSRLVQRLQTFREDCQARMETLGRASLEEARGRCGALQAEADGLRIQLGDREKALELLRLQTEGDVQTTVQHGRIIDTLHQEKNHLAVQLNERKLEVQQLRAELAERDSGLAALEQDRRELQASLADLAALEQDRRELQASLAERDSGLAALEQDRRELQASLAELQASLAEQRRRFQQATLEKRQLAARVNAQRTQLLLLSEGHKGDVLKLRSQLKSSHAELEQARRSLRTLEGADGHGLQVAMGMQKRITEGREQMDSLQGRIQQQEAAMEELYQEKHCQDLESQRQVQMLLSLREDKRRLAEELLALRSNERLLQDRASSLEAALHKMSESFADCQDVIHLQEQEFIRLKLQHALDLKERQGQDLHSPATAVSSSVSPAVPPALAAIPPSSSTRQASRILKKPKAQKLKERLTQELRPQVKELLGSFSENCRPHTGSTTACSLLRRESTPESTHRTTPELHLQRTPDLNHHHSAFISGTPLGRRSPVHSLLTSVPDLELLRHRPEAIRIPTCD